MKTAPSVNLCRGCFQPAPRGRTWHSECSKRYRASSPYRAQTLRRDGYACAHCSRLWNRVALATCSAFGRQRSVDVDHIDPLALTGTNDPTNLQVLCKRHHRRKTRVDMARIMGWRPPVTLSAGLGWLALMALLVFALYALAPSNPAEWHDTSRGIRFVAVLAFGWAMFTQPRRITQRAKARVMAAVAPGFGIPLTQQFTTVKAEKGTAQQDVTLRCSRYTLRRGRFGIPHWTPQRIRVRYPWTFHDHDTTARQRVEDRLQSKLGGSWTARWDTAADRVEFISPDPLVGLEGTPWPMADAPRTNLWQPIPVGIGQDGKPITLSIVEKHLLIGGETGSGKSVSLSMLVAAAALDPDVTLHGIDGKALVELGPWADSFDDLVADMPKAIEVLRELVTIINGRFQMLQAEGRRKVEPGDGMGLHVLVVDELAYFTDGDGTKAEREEFIRLVRDVISRGRAAGVVGIFATQRPSADVVPTRVRDLIGYRWALRAATPTTSDMILGQGQAAAGANAARIAAEHRGMGWLLAEGLAPVRLRSYLLTDGDVRTLAGRAARLRGSGPVEPDGWAAAADQPSPST